MLDVLIGRAVQPTLITPFEELDEAGDQAKRFLKVVGGDVREAGKLGIRLFKLPFPALALANLGRDDEDGHRVNGNDSLKECQRIDPSVFSEGTVAVPSRPNREAEGEECREDRAQKIETEGAPQRYRHQ